jgi:hypothetical protein
MDGRGRSTIVGRPHLRPIEANVVRSDCPRYKVFDEKERIVVSFDREGAGLPAEDLDLAGGARLDPERGALGARVAQQRSEHQTDRGRHITRSNRHLEPDCLRSDE